MIGHSIQHINQFLEYRNSCEKFADVDKNISCIIFEGICLVASRSQAAEVALLPLRSNPWCSKKICLQKPPSVEENMSGIELYWHSFFRDSRQGRKRKFYQMKNLVFILRIFWLQQLIIFLIHYASHRPYS